MVITTPARHLDISSVCDVKVSGCSGHDHVPTVILCTERTPWVLGYASVAEEAAEVSSAHGGLSSLLSSSVESDVTFSSYWQLVIRMARKRVTRTKCPKSNHTTKYTLAAKPFDSIPVKAMSVQFDPGWIEAVVHRCVCMINY